MSPEEIAKLVAANVDANCDAGWALRILVRCLAEANMQEANEDESDDEYERAAQAKLALFLIASRATNGHRWPEES